MRKKTVEATEEWRNKGEPGEVKEEDIIRRAGERQPS